MAWDEKRKMWKEDEWLTQIYATLCEAKLAIREFAEGRPYDNNRETQVTRYFGKNRNPFDRRAELPKGSPGIMAYEWMRYTAYTISEKRSERYVY